MEQDASEAPKAQTAAAGGEAAQATEGHEADAMATEAQQEVDAAQDAVGHGVDAMEAEAPPEAGAGGGLAETTEGVTTEGEAGAAEGPSEATTGAVAAKGPGGASEGDADALLDYDSEEPGEGQPGDDAERDQRREDKSRNGTPMRMEATTAAARPREVEGDA